jgi:hypothetical protein
MDASDPNRIIAVTPLLDATATGEFDAEPLSAGSFGGKAAVIHVDTSVGMVPIDPDTRQISVRENQTLLETGEGTLWGNAIHPVIKPPLTPPGWLTVAQCKRRTEQAWVLGGGAVLAFIALWLVLRRKRRRVVAV